MHIIAKILVGLIALEHCYIMYLEMFRWTAPRTRKTFGLTEEFAEATKVMAGNQGLYNGFLAAGLIWAIIAPPMLGYALAKFFCGCVIVAGLYGGATATPRIYVVQALPAAIALLAVIFL